MILIPACPELDVILTVDTAVAHLSAALGKHTWILLPARAYFRWLLDRTDSPWYHSVQVFRQPKSGDLASVMPVVTQALQTKIAAPTLH